MKVDKNNLTVVLKLGETHVSRERITFRCYGLGSCIGLFLYDSQTSNTAGAHIMLPGKYSMESESPTAFTTNAIEHMIQELKRLGSSLKNLRAKLVGGANVANISTISIGIDNIEAVRNELQKNNIPIMGMDVGGTMVRSAKFCAVSRQLFVTSIDAKNIFPQTIISTTYA